MECNSNYATYKYVRKLPYDIVNKLVADCPELWKLMKYVDPVGKPDLTPDEISKMICPDSMNVDKYNVVFQKFSREAMADETGSVFAQMRIQVLNNHSVNNMVGRVSIVMEFVVNQKQMVCTTDLTPYDNRAMAMTQAVIETLNGNKLNTLDTNDDNYLFINGKQDMTTGFRLVNFNTEFSGYQLIIDANITG